MNNQSILRKMREIVRSGQNSTGDDAEAHPHQKGLDFVAKGEFVKAAAAFREAVWREPDFFLSYYHLGVVLEILGEKPAAQKAFRRAVEINAYHAPSFARLGDLLLNEDAAAAIEFFRRAISIQADDLTALRGMTRLVKLNLADRAEVINLLQKAYEMRRSVNILFELFELRAVDFDFCAALADDLSEKESFAKAALFYRLALRRHPTDETIRKKSALIINLLDDTNDKTPNQDG